MKRMPFILLLLSLLTLHACGLNTKFDDADYRPVGASAPVNSETHTLNETQIRVVENRIENNTENDLKNSTTRYITPGSETNSPATKDHTAKTDSETITAHSQKNSSKANSNRPNSLTSTLADAFSSRYGNSESILKISKTVQIHCNNKAVKNPSLSICQYQFPEFCGAHQFSVIKNMNKQLLMFIDKDYQRNVIDTISGAPKSAPGLWDDDDYVSSELLTVRQLLNNTSSQPDSLGWIVNIDNHEKAQLGRSYYAAINETSKCF